MNEGDADEGGGNELAEEGVELAVANEDAVKAMVLRMRRSARLSWR